MNRQSLPRGTMRGEIDYSLMSQHVPPIAGPGTEQPCGLTGWSWCGYCGYTGRCLGPVQASCPERHGWHAWLERNADYEAARLVASEPARLKLPDAPRAQPWPAVTAPGLPAAFLARHRHPRDATP